VVATPRLVAMTPLLHCPAAEHNKDLLHPACCHGTLVMLPTHFCWCHKDLLCCPDPCMCCCTTAVVLSKAPLLSVTIHGATRTCYAPSAHCFTAAHHLVIVAPLTCPPRTCYTTPTSSLPPCCLQHHPNAIVAATLPCWVGTLVAISHGHHHHGSTLCWGAPLMLHL